MNLCSPWKGNQIRPVPSLTLQTAFQTPALPRDRLRQLFLFYEVIDITQLPIWAKGYSLEKEKQMLITCVVLTIRYVELSCSGLTMT